MYFMVLCIRSKSQTHIHTHVIIHLTIICLLLVDTKQNIVCALLTKSQDNSFIDEETETWG